MIVWVLLTQPPHTNNMLLFAILLQKTEAIITQEDGTKRWKNNCWQVREDYFECLHAKKEWAMVRRVADEEKRQAEIAANGQQRWGIMDKNEGD